MVRIFFIWLEHVSCLLDFAKIGCYCLLTLQHVLCVNRIFNNIMPRVYKSTLGSQSYAAYSVEALDNTLSDIQTKVLTQRQASVKYNIPRSTLKTSWRERMAEDYYNFHTGRRKKFKAYVFTTSAYGFPVDMFNLRCIVKAYADRKGMKIRHFKNNMPGTEWALSFLRCH